MKAFLIEYETMGTEALDPETDAFIGYDNIESGTMVMHAESEDELEPDHAEYRKFKVLGELPAKYAAAPDFFAIVRMVAACNMRHAEGEKIFISEGYSRDMSFTPLKYMDNKAKELFEQYERK